MDVSNLFDVDCPDSGGLSHGARPVKHNRRKRKGAMDYASENRDDFTVKTILNKGSQVDVLVCKFCAVPIGARSDRIKEHLSSKRHLKLKKDATPAPPVSTPIINIRNNSELSKAFPTSEAYVPQTSPQWNFTAEEAMAMAFPEMAVKRGNDTGLENHTTVENGMPVAPSLLLGQFMGPPQSQTKSTTNLIVKWNKYGKVYRQAFRNFQADGTFTDVTLVAEGRSIGCHKLILCAGSDYFLDVLKNEANANPIIIMHNTPFWQLELLVKYMYKGDVLVPQDKLSPLLKTAEQLGIRGLSQATDPEGPHKPFPEVTATQSAAPAPNNFLFGPSTVPQETSAINLSGKAPGMHYSTGEAMNHLFSDAKCDTTTTGFLYNGVSNSSDEQGPNNFAFAGPSSSGSSTNSANLPLPLDFPIWPFSFGNDVIKKDTDLSILKNAADLNTGRKRKFKQGGRPNKIFGIGLSGEFNSNSNLNDANVNFM